MNARRHTDLRGRLAPNPSGRSGAPPRRGPRGAGRVSSIIVWASLAAGTMAVWEAAARADDEICEDVKGEAGSVSSTAYRAVGSGPIRVINGSLAAVFAAEAQGPVPDGEDLYLVQIVDPAAFMAQTVVPGEPPLFDTSLWLLGPCAAAALGNQSKPGVQGTPFALLLSEANDDTGFVLATPGVYFIGVSGGTRIPLSEAGEMFIFATPQEISGPDGPGADLPVQQWAGSLEQGNYRVLLDGVSFLGVQSACAADFNGDFHVDGIDLGSLLSQWGGCQPGVWCAADLNRDGKVAAADLGLLLASWGECAAIGTPCGDPTAGSCADADSTPGCDDPCCCTLVCQMLPDCCSIAWDDDCVLIGQLICPFIPAN